MTATPDHGRIVIFWLKAALDCATIASMTALPMIRDVRFEETPEHLKVVLPVRRNWPATLLFSVMVIVWLVLAVWGIVYGVQVAFSGQSYAFWLTVFVLIWLYIWYRLGKLVWGRWQYYATNREILFINKERLIVRRPVSILGLTDAYDMQHVSPFLYSEEHGCPGFEYGHQRIYFGQGILDEASARRLVKTLNGRFFHYADDEDDE